MNSLGCSECMYACNVCVSVCVRDYERHLDLFVCNCYCCLFTRMDGMWLWIWYGSLVCVAMRASFSMWMWETNECCLRCTFWRLFLVNKSDMCMDEYIQMLILTYRWTLNICMYTYILFAICLAKLEHFWSLGIALRLCINCTNSLFMYAFAMHSRFAISITKFS